MKIRPAISIYQKFMFMAACFVFFANGLVSCSAFNQPYFEVTECLFFTESSRETECGYILVPEDRSKEDSPMIELHFAIVPSPNDKKATDPVLVLHGGPGGNALDMMDGWVSLLRISRPSRDIIVLDQRGTGYSKPSLNCPELETPFYQHYAENLTTEEENQYYIEHLQACHDRLVQEGVDLNTYNSAASAADVDDLRKALGYKQWNLYGVSYGTRLALTVMRDYPKGVRSVVLDSVYPPQIDFSAGLLGNYERALDLIFETCAADPQCSQVYPDLEQVFFEVVDRLDEAPVTLEIARQKDQEKYVYVVNGDRLLMTFFDLLYSSNTIGKLPRLIYQIAEGDWNSFSSLIQWGVFGWDDISDGMYFAVQCYEEAPFSSPEIVEAAQVGVNPRLSQAMDSDDFLFERCKVLELSPAPVIENEPVVSDIPTLILAGEHDPVTPPANGLSTAEYLSQSQYLEFPRATHTVLGFSYAGAKCYSGKIVEAFFKDPTASVDGSCVADIPPLFGAVGE